MDELIESEPKKKAKQYHVDYKCLIAMNTNIEIQEIFNDFFSL